jgi:hypothetical protein
MNISMKLWNTNHSIKIKDENSGNWYAPSRSEYKDKTLKNYVPRIPD